MGRLKWNKNFNFIIYAVFVVNQSVLWTGNKLNESSACFFVMIENKTFK